MTIKFKRFVATLLSLCLLFTISFPLTNVEAQDRKLMLGTGSVQQSGSTLLTGLAAFYKLADTSDSVGSNTLTNTGSVTFGTGLVGNAATFNGTNYLSVESPNFSMGDVDWTVAGWARTPDPDAGNQIIISRNGRFEWRVYFAENRISANVYDSSDIVFDVSANNWVHYRLTFIAATDTIEFEINNDGNVQTASPGGDIEDGSPLFFGTQDQGGGTTNFFVGDADATGIWLKQLTSTEQANFFNSSAGREHPFN